MYSFDRPDVFRALQNAHKRHVHVQILVNDNWTSSQTRRMKRILGHDIHKKSFLRICKASCRGARGNLHMKVYSFTKTGTTKDVIFTGSSNLTNRAVQLQWNDLYGISDPGLFDTWVKVFDQAKFDKHRAKRWVTYTDDHLDANWYRSDKGSDSGTTTWSHHGGKVPKKDDPVFKRLKQIDCKTEKGYGRNKHTLVRIMMYGWSGNRGKYLADRVAYLKRQGCNVKLILSVPGGGVVKRLAAAHIPMRSADWRYLSDGTVDFYSHLKVLAVNGTYAGKPTRTFWTGSENWSDRSFHNDELTIHITGDKPYAAYFNRFNTLWNRQTHAMGIHPTGYPPR
jgi:phosphatidylserine/phosphatidylglycerophosphate/cardiolipin synthase-like enzyme